MFYWVVVAKHDKNIIRKSYIAPNFNLIMAIDYLAYVDRDFPHPEVTRKMIEAACRQLPIYRGADVRAAAGRLSTTEELDARRADCEREWEEYIADNSWIEKFVIFLLKTHQIKSLILCFNSR